MRGLITRTRTRHNCLTNTIWIWTALLLLLVFSKDGFCKDDDFDTKLWVEQELTHSFSDKLSYKLIFDERFYKNITTWEELYIDTGISYKPFSWLVLNPMYRHKRADFNISKEAVENRYHMNVELIAKLKHLTLESRSRYEYRTFEDSETKHRFLERIRVSVPLPFWKINDKSVEAFLSDELNYDLDKDMSTHHEMMLGTKLPFSKKFIMKWYYGHELKYKNGSWGFNTHIFGISTVHNF
jgi:hypothetical protein